MSTAYNAARRRAAARQGLSRPQAARLLKRSILGPRRSEIDAMVGGNYEAWLDAQMAMPPWQLLHEMHLSQEPGSYLRRARLADGSYVDISRQGISNPGAANIEPGQLGGYRESCLKFAEIEHPDVLRHRVCRALLELLVCSVVGQSNEFFTWGGSLTGYYSRLQRTCFGTFRDILRDISLSPEMSIYLTYLGNQRANAATGTQPDENYAREIMQLFSIGLTELNLDGTRRKSGQLDPTDPRYVAGGTDDVPTYGASDIKAVARIFTGTLVPRANVTSPESSRFVRTSQGIANIGGSIALGAAPDGMLSNIGFFSADNEAALPKQALPGPGGFLLDIPAGVGGVQAFDMLLDALVSHPSCAPYISGRLIRLLTCSNPTPEYVARVASVFVDNGQGQRGDMKALWKAIFLDQDVVGPTENGRSIKARDIDHAMRSAMRALSLPGMIDPQLIMVGSTGTPAPGTLRARDLEHRSFTASSRNNPNTKGPFQAGSVFGTYPTGFATRAVRDAGMIAGELHTWDEAQISEQSGADYKSKLRNVFALRGRSVAAAVADAALSATFDEFAELMSGVQISPPVKAQILSHVQAVSDNNERFDRLVECLTLTAAAVIQE